MTRGMFTWTNEFNGWKEKPLLIGSCEHPRVDFVNYDFYTHVNVSSFSSRDGVDCGAFRKLLPLQGNFGFVHFKDPDGCREALSILSKKVINGNTPRVQLAEIKKGIR